MVAERNPASEGRCDGDTGHHHSYQQSIHFPVAGGAPKPAKTKHRHDLIANCQDLLALFENILYSQRGYL